MIILTILLVLPLITTGLYVYFFEYLKNGILYYTIPLLYLGGLIVVFILFIGFLFLCLALKPKEKFKQKFYYFFIKEVARAILIIFREKIILENSDLIPQDSKFLLVSNHQSLHDSVAIVSIFSKYHLSFIMKESISNIPLVGAWLKSTGFLPIDRNNDRNALKTIVIASKRLASGEAIGIYPEGTRSKTTEINEFRNGIFKIAQKACAPVVVCLVDNFYSVKKRFPFKRTKVIVRICKVLDYEEIQDIHTNEVGEFVRNLMITNQKEVREKYPWIEYKKS